MASLKVAIERLKKSPNNMITQVLCPMTYHKPIYFHILFFKTSAKMNCMENKLL